MGGREADYALVIELKLKKINSGAAMSEPAKVMDFVVGGIRYPVGGVTPQK